MACLGKNPSAAPHWDLCILRTSWLQSVAQLQVLLVSWSNPLDVKVRSSVQPATNRPRAHRGVPVDRRHTQLRWLMLAL
jgi:hypothetical protein